MLSHIVAVRSSNFYLMAVFEWAPRVIRNSVSRVGSIVRLFVLFIHPFAVHPSIHLSAIFRTTFSRQQTDGSVADTHTSFAAYKLLASFQVSKDSYGVKPWEPHHSWTTWSTHAYSHWPNERGTKLRGRTSMDDLRKTIGLSLPTLSAIKNFADSTSCAWNTTFLLQRRG